MKITLYISHCIYLAGHFQHQNLAQCMKHLTGIAEVLGFIPTRNSENLFSCPCTHCQASSISDTGVFNIISPATQDQLIVYSGINSSFDSTLILKHFVYGMLEPSWVTLMCAFDVFNG